MEIVNQVNDIIWTYILIALLLIVGVTLTLSSRFVQIRYFLRMFRILGQAFQHSGGGHLSSFQALVLSVGGRVGGGNIAGVAVAITLGGPGAIFWMWVVGLIGMATSFFECTLAQVFKKAEPDGTFRGGPAYYMTRGLKLKGMAAVFSVLLLVTFALGFNAVQAHVVASSLESSFGISELVTGIIMVAVIGIIIFGGVKRIAEVAEIVVPIMAIGYFAMAVVVIFLNIGELGGVFSQIFRGAFGLDQAVGGGIGAAIIWGVRRGLFSNEAGLGSAPNVAAVAYVKHPASQGIVQAFSVFIDTVVLCTCTAAIILLSDVYQVGAAADGVALTQNAMGEHIGRIGEYFVSIALLLFAFSSILYNYYLGENSLNYFSEENKPLFNGLRVVVLALVFWGSIEDLGTVFGFADLTQGLLALVNLVALILLFKVGLRVLGDFDGQLKAGVARPVFDHTKFSDLDIDVAAWTEDDEQKS